MTAAIYCRKSTATEGKSKSRDEQLEICRHDAERFGFGAVIEFMEPEGQRGEWYWADKDGRFPAPHRPELGRLVEMVERGEVQAVLIYKQNRLVRDNGVEDALAKLFLRKRVRLIVGGRDCELDTARGRCDSAQAAARAREWRDQIEEDVKRDHDYKYRMGLFTRNPACYGFRSKGRGTQGVEFRYDELANVRRIFDWFVGRSGESPLGTHQIAKRCEREGIYTAVGAKGHKAVYPKRVSSSQIESILENCMYVGEWQHNGQRKTYPQLFVQDPNDPSGPPQPLIGREVWDEAQMLLKNRPRLGVRGPTSDRMLTGLVVCGSCGRPCHANYKRLGDGTVVWRWGCPHRSGRGKTYAGASFASIYVHELDAWVEDFAAPMVAAEFEDLLREREESASRLALVNLERELAESKELETKRLKSALRHLDDTAFEELARSLRADREQLERQVFEARREFRAAGDTAIAADPGDLRSQDPAVVKTALRRSLRWIALTDKGVIVYNVAGNYLAGRYRERDLSIYGSEGNYRRIEPPDLDATIDSIEWIADKSKFAEGRRYSLGPMGERATPEDLVPDWLGEE